MNSFLQSGRVESLRKFSFLYRAFSDRLIAIPGAALIPGLSTEWIRCYHIFLIILLVQVLVKQQTRCEVVLNPSEYLDVEGKAGQPIALPIAAGPATGYAWSLALPEGVERTEDGPASPVDPSARLGGAAGGYLQVTAPAGEHLIIARLARPWEPDQPVRVVGIHLHVV